MACTLCCTPAHPCGSNRLTPQAEQTISAPPAGRNRSGFPRYPSALAGCLPPLAEHRRTRLVDLPVEEVVLARPRVDLAPAHLATEGAGMLVGVMLPRRGIG